VLYFSFTVGTIANFVINHKIKNIKLLYAFIAPLWVFSRYPYWIDIMGRKLKKMNNKLLEQFKKGEVILYTPTFEDFKALMEWCDTQNIKWCDGDKAMYNMSIIFEANKDFTQGVENNTDGMVFISSSYIRFNKATFTASDLQQDKPTFTKDDLRVGMIVEMRDGDKGVVQKQIIASIEQGHCYQINSYDVNLIHQSLTEDMDIAKIYTTNNLIEVLNGNYDSLELVWERDAFDWSKVEADSKILVSMDNIKWERRHFAKYENGLIYAWHNGYTSFTAPLENYYDFFSAWKFAKLYKGDNTSI
jgi:hypothetical protein